MGIVNYRAVLYNKQGQKGAVGALYSFLAKYDQIGRFIKKV